MLFDLTTESDSLRRARTEPCLIQLDPDGETYIVTFRDSEAVHAVTLTRTPDGWDATCKIRDADGTIKATCDGWQYHDGPCSHIWAVRSHIAAQRRADPDARHNTAPRTATDGGTLR